MMDTQASKKPRPRIDRTHLSPADQLAFERVAALLNKPLSELYEENPHNTGMETSSAPVDLCPAENAMYTGLQSWPIPVMQLHALGGWKQGISCGEIDNRVSQRSGPWSRPSGIILGEESLTDIAFNQSPENISQAPDFQLGSRKNHGDSDITDHWGLRRSPSWLHEATADEEWVGVPTDFLTQANFQDGMIGNTEQATILSNVAGEEPTKVTAIPHQYDLSRGQRQEQDTMDRTSNRPSPSTSNDLFDSNENRSMFDLDWEDLQNLEMPQASSGKSQLASSAEATTSGWSIIESPGETFLPDNSNPKSVEWVPMDPSGKELPSKKPQRRGPFLDQQLKEETSSMHFLTSCFLSRMIHKQY